MQNACGIAGFHQRWSGEDGEGEREGNTAICYHFQLLFPISNAEEIQRCQSSGKNLIFPFQTSRDGNGDAADSRQLILEGFLSFGFESRAAPGCCFSFFFLFHVNHEG